MQIDDEMERAMKSFGGEDLIRYLLKDDGIQNWQTVKFHPIVAYSPLHMDDAELAGIAYWNGAEYSIAYSEDNFLNDRLNEWLEGVMDFENHDTEAQALLSYNMAIIATSNEIDESKNIGWEIIISEVLYGFRSNNYHISKERNNTHINNISVDMDLLTSFFDILLDTDKFFRDKKKNHILAKQELGFPDGFQDEWA